MPRAAPGGGGPGPAADPAPGQPPRQGKAGVGTGFVSPVGTLPVAELLCAELFGLQFPIQTQLSQSELVPPRNKSSFSLLAPWLQPFSRRWEWKQELIRGGFRPLHSQSGFLLQSQRFPVLLGPLRLLPHGCCCLVLWLTLTPFQLRAQPLQAALGARGTPRSIFFPPLFVCRDGSRSQPCHNNLPLAFPCVSPVSVLVSSTSSPWLSSGVPRVSSGAQHRARSRLCFGALGGAPLNGRAPGGACCLRGHVLPFVPGLCREDRCRALGGVETHAVPPPRLRAAFWGLSGARYGRGPSGLYKSCLAAELDHPKCLFSRDACSNSWHSPGRLPARGPGPCVQPPPGDTHQLAANAEWRLGTARWCGGACGWLGDVSGRDRASRAPPDAGLSLVAVPSWGRGAQVSPDVATVLVSCSPSCMVLLSTPSRRFGFRVPHSYPIPPRAPPVCCGKQPTSGDGALGKAQWGSGSGEEPPPPAFPRDHGCRRLICIAGASREKAAGSSAHARSLSSANKALAS